MTYMEGRNEAGEYFKLALNYIAKYHLSANPVNYTVWYEYVAGKNIKLKKAIDASLGDPGFLTSNSMEMIYQKYVADGDRIVIGKLLTKIALILKDITAYVLETEGNLGSRRKNLSELANQISELHDYNEIKDIVDRMLVETKELVDSCKQLQTGMKISSNDLKQLKQELEKSQQEAQTDLLTSLLNKRGFEKCFELERIRAKQNETPFSLIMLDIDHFKKVNDTFGHLVGDSLLKNIAHLLKSHLRKNDIAVRYGGEEFFILLPETGIQGALAVAQKIRKSLALKEWKLKETGDTIGKITVSMGIALYILNEPKDVLIKRVDDALYLAKNRGRDQIVSEKDL